MIRIKLSLGNVSLSSEPITEHHYEETLHGLREQWKRLYPTMGEPTVKTVNA